VRFFGIFISLALVASACGGDDDDEGSSTTPEGSAAATTPGTDAPDDEPTDTEPADSEPEGTEPEGTEPEGTGGSTGGDGVRLGIMAECEGAFGGFNEDVQAGVALAMINEAGATSNSRTTSLDGFSGATAGGLPIEVVSVGCGDDTADRAIQEIR
jgi:branched-chain amino acid transport system substrate-binding protein